ncbi:MAG: FtsK/SpoIIIE domain-containing protein [Bythopirellula sp.]|nr:FtsK/SpoIIIE domain-containing protein [Bythopirellula sp.]
MQLSTRRVLELMQHLQQLADARAADEARLATTLTNELMAAEKEYQTTLNKLTRDFTEKRRSLENEFANAKLAAGQEFREAKTEHAKQLDNEQSRVAADHKQHALLHERKHKEKQWESLAVFDASKDAPQQLLDQAGKRIQTRKLQTDGLERDGLTLLGMRKLTKHADMPAKRGDAAPPLTEKNAEDQQQATVSELQRAVIDLQAQTLPSLLLEGNRFLLWLALAIVAMILPAMLVTNYSVPGSALGAIVSGTIITGLGYLILKPRAVKQSLDQFARIQELLGNARHWESQAWQEAQARSRQEAEAIHQRKQQELTAAQDQRDKAFAEGEVKKEELLALAEQRYQSRLAESEARQQGVLAAADEKYPPLLDQLATDRQAAWQANETRYAERTATANSEQTAGWETMAATWRSGFEQVTEELAAMQAACDEFFPDWNETAWQDWQRSATIPPVIQFGHCQLPLQAVKNGVSQEPRLVPEQTQLQLPAWLSLDEQPRMMITTEGSGRAAAVDLLQLMMFRFLTAVPAGMLRFTIIDPSALGQNFATFMHLADHDQQLVGKRIWTDPRQIEERLALLAEHMERMLQKYLRNEFASIHEYNVHAGEVSEPYHVLVVANFPTGLSDGAIRRLKTIATTGPKCGVYTLMNVDTTVKLPTDFSLPDLLNGAVHLDWVEERLRWKYPLFEKLALQLETLPPKDKLNEVLRHAAEESRTASRVEVPFAVVAPSVEQMWSENSATELVVPIGRAGANELQSLRLGKGTAQHALISGKTGSGKSTLLHALVTNLALRYSPREVEFYLVDFKKGVEFKTYATHQLPHARVIAIESEREFGVSVLERLDAELRQRGERFRALGVQDLASYRRESGETLPRILLVIDEFQELFVSDDKLAQDAALLLDRLVRQGRAFGVHVLLGSQTLAGAYSLARSTLGQMAVRIALECSEADAHLILSDDNPAARLLSRPGEAIYNDQNGMVEGNHLFQVVWLPDHQRQEYLAEIRARQEVEELTVEPAIVFEGNVPADPMQNEVLVKLLTEEKDATVSEPTVWLGSAVRIEPATQMTFRRQGGNNLLIVGQDEPLALGVLSTAVAALAAQLAGEAGQITVLDGTRAESAQHGTWQKLAQTLPVNVAIHSARETTRVVTQLAVEVARRGEQAEAEHEPRFLVIHNLAQLRDLRLTEEEFSFSSSTNGKAPSVDKRFREILREGPAVGVYVLMWCDSHNSLMRTFDRLTLREVDYRVVLQMSLVDSTSLIDSPAAGKLGEHRAIFYRDDTGLHTKFRPYGLPSAEWLKFLNENSGTRMNADFSTGGSGGSREI